MTQAPRVCARGLSTAGAAFFDNLGADRLGEFVVVHAFHTEHRYQLAEAVDDHDVGFEPAHLLEEGGEASAVFRLVDPEPVGVGDVGWFAAHEHEAVGDLGRAVVVDVEVDGAVALGEGLGDGALGDPRFRGLGVAEHAVDPAPVEEGVPGVHV